MSKVNRSVVSEADLRAVDGIARGDTTVLESLYRDYYPMVLNMVIRNNGSEEEAKDLFQEAVIVLYDKVRQGEFELSSKLKTYLYSVCRRLWLKQLGAQERAFHDVSGFEEVIPVSDDLATHRETEIQLTLMEQALNKLGEPCRTIIHDFYILNLSMQQICDKFGYTSSDNAKNQKYKCLQRLKRLFFSST